MIAHKPPRITLLATTRGRLEPVRRLFESLETQTCHDFMLLLGDQNPRGYLDGLVAEYRDTFLIEHVYLSPQGLSHARNMLLPYVIGDVVALTDDDCHYAPDCLERVTELFDANPQMSALVGNANGRTSTLVIEQKESRISLFRNAPSWVLFFRTTVMREVGYFDENLGIGSSGPYQSGEETDYLLRVFASGRGSILRSSDVCVFHDDFSSDHPSLVAKTKGYALGRMYLLRKHDFPLWFKLANVLYPLIRLPFDGGHAWPYRKNMFLGRLRGLFQR